MQASSSLEKHCRNALSWVSTTTCCRFILLLGPAIILSGLSHDFLRYRSVCFTLTIFHDFGVPASLIPLHLLGLGYIIQHYIYVRPCVDHERHDSILTLACRPGCGSE
jgi:hypothetical protein